MDCPSEIHFLGPGRVSTLDLAHLLAQGLESHVSGSCGGGEMCLLVPISPVRFRGSLRQNQLGDYRVYQMGLCAGSIPTDDCITLVESVPWWF